eukprot:1159757-Pelagomonas_calceolata.AAC.6
MGFQAGGRRFTCACMIHSRRQQQRGSIMGPVQQGLAAAGCHATSPGGPGLSYQMERWKKGMSKDQDSVLEA